MNYQVLFSAQGTNLTPAQVEEAKISTARALQLPLKLIMLESITNKQVIGKQAVKLVVNSTSILNMTMLCNKSLEELRSLSIKQVQWHSVLTLGFTLNDG